MALPFVLDNGVATRARLGVVILETDETLESDLRTVFNQPGIGLFHTRIPNAQTVTQETLTAMRDEMPAVLKLLPHTVPLDVVGYGCTSASTLIGPENVAAIVNAIHPHAKVTNPISGVIAACQALGVNRLGLVTPYSADISAAMQDTLTNNGIAVTAFGSFEQTTDANVARLSPQSILDAMITIGSSDETDAVFASCTNLNTFAIIEEAEAKIGKPVISSNQAMAWHMATLAGLSADVQGPGHVFLV